MQCEKFLTIRFELFISSCPALTGSEQTRELASRGEENLTMPLFCDANTGWKMHEALRVVNAVKDLDVYIEQPCLSYDECLSVRRLCPLPMILDECVDSLCKALASFPTA